MCLNKLTRNQINKKAAIEISVGTIVILVIGITMLMLGLFFVEKIREIITGTTNLIDDNVRTKINKLFNEEDENLKVGVYLPDNNADVKKGKKYIVGFAIKNVERGEAGEGTFSYEIKATEVSQGCNLTLQRADTYLEIGKAQTFRIASGDISERKVHILVPKTAPLCSISYDITIKKDGQLYDTAFFTINIVK